MFLLFRKEKIKTTQKKKNDYYDYYYYCRIKENCLQTHMNYPPPWLILEIANN